MAVTGRLIDADTLFRRQDFYSLVWLGKIPGYSIVQKFGRNLAVGTTVVPIAIGANYRTPTSAVTLEVISNDSDDTAAGTGARNVILEGLDSNFNLIQEEVVTNGLSASLPTSLSFIRLFRAKVTKSGSYASQTASSQHGTITIRQSGGGATWAIIDEIATDFGVGQSQIACYTIRKGYTGILLSKFTSIDVNQAANVYFFQRPNANVVTPPYEGMRLVQQETGIKEVYNITPIMPINIFQEYTDIGFMGKTTQGAASISCNFELLMIDNEYI